MSATTHKATGQQNIVDQLEEFLRENYKDDIGVLAQHYPKERKSLYIEAKDLYMFNQDLLDDWLNQPDQMQALAEDALGLVDLPVAVSDDFEVANVRLTDTSDGEYIPVKSLSELQSDTDIGSYIGISGEISKITDTSPRLEVAVFVCQRCANEEVIEQPPSEIETPEQCSSCEREGPFKADEDLFKYTDQLKIKFQPPLKEQVNTGSQEDGHELIRVLGDLCEYGGENGLGGHAGEQCVVYGKYTIDKSLFNQKNAAPVFDTWFDAHAFVFDDDDYDDLNIEEHKDEFEELAKRDDAHELVQATIAADLYREEGDDLYDLCRGAVAYLFSGYRLDPEGMGSKRGDVHMAAFGDPGVGKSTVVSDLNFLSPQSIYRSGTGVTSVGLTAAAVQEEFDGQSRWTIEPGILPRGNGGHTIIDEIDDVVNEDTKKMHDALEGEQVATVDKAGMSADLPTRTGVLVSGNPVEGRFDQYQPIPQQIGLDPALSDRMDLMFALTDDVDEEKDTLKAEHVLDATEDYMRAELADDPEDYEPENVDRPIDPEVLRAWIAYARENVFPVLTEEAKDVLTDFYIEIRDSNDGHSGDDESPIPATVRSLEAGVRIATAYARVNLSDTIDEKHAQLAANISKKVVGLNYDPDSGNFDVGKNSVGGTQSMKKRRDGIVETLREMQNSEEYQSESGVPEDDLKEAVEAQEIDVSKFDHDIQKARDKGEIYAPQQGVFRAV